MRRLHEPQKACIKEAYLLPSINHFLDRVVDHNMCFLDAYLGYNEIPMVERG